MSGQCADAAVTEDKGDVRFIYDVDFDFRFDNRELYRSRFSNSMTIFGVRLTPYVGVQLSQPDKNLRHQVMMGVDVMKDFGASPLQNSFHDINTEDLSTAQMHKDLFREIVLYYNMNHRRGNTEITLNAGIFPRKLTEGDYSDVFFSDSLKFYDNNLEGILFKVRSPKVFFEVGCDWFGKKSDFRKEKFMIFSGAEFAAAHDFKVGYAGYMYHFAGSYMAEGVVDNILFNPYMKLDLGRHTALDVLSFKLGWVQALQHDRVFVGHYVFPSGAEFDVDISRWNFGISNHFFYGNDMMPYYNCTDAAGYKYGSRLYLGDPFYRIHDDGISGPGIYDRLGLYYQTDIGKRLSVRVEALFHFNGVRYSGCQQIVSLNFNL